MKNLAATLNHKGKNYSLTDLQEIPKTINNLERRVFDARLKGASFSEIENPKWNIDQIIIRGAAICGCAVPATEFFADIISEEITRFILDFGYGQLTYEEILLAMRMNAKGDYHYIIGLEIEPVTFFGTSFNVEYFGKLLRNYKVVRNQLDRKLMNHIDGYANH